MRRRRNPIIWQGPVLVFLIVFVAYGAYNLFTNMTKAPVSASITTSKEKSMEISSLERQIKAVQSENVLLQKELASANERIVKLEKQLKGIDNILATLSNPFAPGDELASVDAVKSGEVTITPLNIRKEAKANSPKVGSLTKGTKVQIVEEKKVTGVTWYRVATDHYNGWVHGNYIKLE